MPIYAYRCSACGHRKDVLQKLSDAPLVRCPACGADAFSKQVTAAGFQLKGSGWYVTDFRNPPAKAGDKPADKPGEGVDGKPGDKAADKPADGAGAPAGQGKAGDAKPASGTAPAPAAKPDAPSASPAPAPAPTSGK